MTQIRYIDLFAGAGGLSEGFVKAGFTPVAHVEFDKAACYTLKTRVAYHYLKKSNPSLYEDYLLGEISRKKLYSSIPDTLLDSVINAEIGKDNELVFSQIDNLNAGGGIDLIIGGPPCQAYSVVGRAPLKHKEKDNRTTLYLDYGKFLERYNPKMFVFENVPGLLSSSGGLHFENLQNYYRSLGYIVKARLLNAYDFGVVQHRKRVIIIGWKDELNLSFPEIPKTSVSHLRDEIFYDLPAIKAGESERVKSYAKDVNEYLSKSEIRNGVSFVTQHISRPHNSNDLAIYDLAIEYLEKRNERLKNNDIPESMRTQKNITDFLDRFKVVGKIPHTMIAHIAKDGHHFIHPDKEQLRSISVREAARIQSFPDNFYFEGIKESQPRTSAYRQIGNAVPPLMAYFIAEEIRKLLDVR